MVNTMQRVMIVSSRPVKGSDKERLPASVRAFWRAGAHCPKPWFIVVARDECSMAARRHVATKAKSVERHHPTAKARFGSLMKLE